MDIDSSAKLAIIATMVTMELAGRVKPSDNFIVNAQTTSSQPATKSRIQAMTSSHRLCRVRSRPRFCFRIYFQ
jgi:hypothetical protein